MNFSTYKLLLENDQPIIMSVKMGKLLRGIRKNVPLAKYSTFNIGGRAEYFFNAKTKKDLIAAVSIAKKNNSPFFILGGGSNVLISDTYHEGIVIKIENKGYKKIRNNICVGAGMSLSAVVYKTARNSLTGLEWAIGIPGTIGGAVFGNAGAFSQSMGNSVGRVEVFDAKTGIVKIFKNKNCEFGYRESAFKRNKNLIILSADLKLRKGDKDEIRNKINEYLKCRKEKQPLNFFSLGSIFKNFAICGKEISGMGQKETGKFKKNGVIPAAWLIEKCGLKGKKIGEAQISEKHANFIINLRNARERDVKKLIELIKKRIKNKFNIILEEEIGRF